MQIVYCPYCGCQAEFVDSSVVYHGRSYGMVYLCRPCDAYVGTHKSTDKPLGRLANACLREKRKAAHQAFDRIWKAGYMPRSAAYGWLSKNMGLSVKDTHIGMFDELQCDAVIWYSWKFFNAA